MYAPNSMPTHGWAPLPEDVATLGAAGADQAVAYLAHREHNDPTPLHRLDGLADELGVGSVFVKDEGYRLGLGSFKALGGSYVVTRLVLEEAARRLGHPVDVGDLQTDAVRAVAATMTFACATDGNHGRSVAQGAQLVGAEAAIFMHGGVSDRRVAAIERFGARIIRVDGSYDDSIIEAARVAEAEGWTVLSDTSWPGYEAIPALVSQGYTVLVRESLDAMTKPPTHVLVQAGVGGFAAAVAGHLAAVLGADRPHVIVVEPERAACLFASNAAGGIVTVPGAEPTVMAMLECYQPSPLAWRVLERVADGFLTLSEDESPAAMRRLAQPAAGDPPIVAGESGVAGLAGLVQLTADPELRRQTGLDDHAIVLVINTEGATDPELYTTLVGSTPEQVLSAEGSAPS
ncbi:MAG: diaminopropionate ammonia-lyase [Candidatus Microthrix parvicella]